MKIEIHFTFLKKHFRFKNEDRNTFFFFYKNFRLKNEDRITFFFLRVLGASWIESL